MNTQPEQRRRLHGDDGGLIVELALVAPLMVLLLLGIIEYGTFYRESANVSQALRSAGRAGTANGAVRSADYNAILSFASQAFQAQHSTINRLVIYKSDSSGSVPSQQCLTGTVPLDGSIKCNVYTGAQLVTISLAASESAAGLGNPNLPLANPGHAPCVAGELDYNYCPTSRDDQQDSAGGPDWVGFYVSATYKSSTGMLPTTVTFTDTELVRIDPPIN